MMHPLQRLSVASHYSNSMRCDPEAHTGVASDIDLPACDPLGARRPTRWHLVAPSTCSMGVRGDDQLNPAELTSRHRGDDGTPTRGSRPASPIGSVLATLALASTKPVRLFMVTSSWATE